VGEASKAVIVDVEKAGPENKNGFASKIQNAGVPPKPILIVDCGQLPSKASAAASASASDATSKSKSE
jgi:hypothetical protein